MQDQTDNLINLIEMFPTISPLIVNQKLNETNQNIEQTIALLLEMDKGNEREQQKKQEDEFQIEDLEEIEKILISEDPPFLTFEQQLSEIRSIKHQEWALKKSMDSNGFGFSDQYGDSFRRETDTKAQLDEIRKKKQRDWQEKRRREFNTNQGKGYNQSKKSEPSDDGYWNLIEQGIDPRNMGFSYKEKGNEKLTEFDLIGIKELELTNKFRKENGLPPLKEDRSLREIGKVHSKNMGEGKVPFGHQGFNDRVSQFPMQHSAAGENVAMSKGYNDVSFTAVNGWIHSPGHRKNLLGNFSHCGIGVYRNSRGAYYSTQLFALV
ncbi:hypothetical protein M0811_05582 [Anaeramoeba ignava]|uniref:CUE domain-containing protein n=1 Tax=Anaeramoeba ignava TaxID=1746090 RepID=A0A9Q0RF63_ANAIG|nr:hypothetical protein M0811_05582 [Anaeramoeba ignava]